MKLKFTYFSDGDQTTGGAPTISCSVGFLNEEQQYALIREISKQQSRLIDMEKGSFRPYSPIKGLPEDSTFEYAYKQVSPTSRSVVFEMSLLEERETVLVPQESFPQSVDEPVEQQATVHQQQGIKSSSVKENTTPDNWFTLFLSSLEQQLNALPHNSSLSSAEQMGRNYAIEELKQFLVSNQENNTLLLFSAYSHFAATQFFHEDRETASLFRLAARSIGSKELNSPVVCALGTINFENEVVNNAHNDVNDDGMFTKIFRLFYPVNKPE